MSKFFSLLTTFQEKFEIEPGFSILFYNFFTILDKLSVISCMHQIKSGEVRCSEPEQVIMDWQFLDYNVVAGGGYDQFLNEKRKASLLKNVATSYGWECLTEYHDCESLCEISFLFALECANIKGKLGNFKKYHEMPLKVRAKTLFELTGDGAHQFMTMGSYLSGEEEFDYFKDKIPHEVSEAALEEWAVRMGFPISFDMLYQLSCLVGMEWVDSLSIYRIQKNKEGIDSDFFYELNYFSCFYWLDFVKLLSDREYYYLIFPMYFLDDTECRIGDTVDMGYLNLDALKLFKQFDLENRAIVV